MAQEATNSSLNMLDSIHQQQLELKRQLTRNPNWTPAGGDHGAGIIPEHLWKLTHPQSKEETAVNDISINNTEMEVN